MMMKRKVGPRRLCGRSQKKESSQSSVWQDAVDSLLSDAQWVKRCFYSAFHSSGFVPFFSSHCLIFLFSFSFKPFPSLCIFILSSIIPVTLFLFTASLVHFCFLLSSNFLCLFCLLLHIYFCFFIFPSSLVTGLCPSVRPACLRVSPDRSQFFRYDSVSLSCDSQSNLTGWKVKRKTLKGGVKTCTSSWGSASLGSTCIIGKAYPSDSGEYWCQSGDGETSNGINITITGMLTLETSRDGSEFGESKRLPVFKDRTVILESPALPVSSGAAVVLRCRAEPNASNHSFNFYKDDRPISSSSAGQMTIHGASKSDEGLYKCGIAGGGESEGSWLAVEGENIRLFLDLLFPQVSDPYCGGVTRAGLVCPASASTVLIVVPVWWIRCIHSYFVVQWLWFIKTPDLFWWF